MLNLSPVQGMHVCDLIDVFADWQQKSGSRDMQLLMLALLDKEQEMPGGARHLVSTSLSSACTMKLPCHSLQSSCKAFAATPAQ